MKQKVIDGDIPGTKEAVKKAIESETRPADILLEALKSAGVRDKVKVLVGGAPISEQFAEQSGADGYAPDAIQAAKAVLDLINA